MKILLLNGPNLQLLGSREPDIYGKTTLASIVADVTRLGKELGFDVEAFQSNSEGELVTLIGDAPRNGFSGIIINPAAYTHTSIAILDAAKSVSLPLVEVHISKVEEREDFRQISYIRHAAIATITGHGTDGYLEAMDLLLAHLRRETTT